MPQLATGRASYDKVISVSSRSSIASPFLKRRILCLFRFLFTSLYFFYSSCVDECMHVCMYMGMHVEA